MTSDRETLRALIVGDGEARIDSFEAAERVKRWLDQHGWRKPYRCPACGSADPNAYLSCRYAGCLDGRDPR